jgi:hypothetical protein
MTSIIFTDIQDNCREVKFEECIPLELKLNLTRYSQKYRELGDILYKYKTNYGYSSQLSSNQTISTEALLYIDELRKLDYEELKKYHSENWSKKYYY